MQIRTWFVACWLLLACAGSVRAEEVATLPPLVIVPSVLGADNTVTLSAAATSGARVRLRLLEKGRPTPVADSLLNLTPAGDRLQASVRLQADPGIYEMQLVSNDRDRHPLSGTATLTVPGLNRSAGWLLLNGSPFLTTTAAQDTSLPLFIAGLKRQTGKRGAFKAHADRVVANAPLGWRTLALPSLVTMTAPGFSFPQLGDQLRNQIQTAQARGERGYLGFALPIDGIAQAAPAVVARAITELRRLLDGIVPDAALIAQVTSRVNGTQPALDVAAVAPLCDAVLVNISADPLTDAWTVKAARRMAEEQKDYDLPIFVETNKPTNTTLDLFMEGATAVLGDTAAQPWRTAVERNLSLFVGSVTLEDIGVLPLSTGDAQPLYKELRGAGRLPQMARLVGPKGEPPVDAFCVPVGDSISDEEVRRLQAAAAAGSRLYLEGATLSVAWKLGPVVGAQVSEWASKRTPGQLTDMVLDDPWLFGTLRGAKLPVEQRFEVVLEPGKVAVQAKAQKGRDVLVAPRAVARYADGMPAMVRNKVDKGQVLYAPSPPKSAAQTSAYYAAVAGSLAPALVTMKAPAPSLLTALRRSPRGAMLLLVTNTSTAPVTTSVAISGVYGVALDLADEKELPVASRGFSTDASLTVSPLGWKLIALASTRKELDDERNTPLLNARIR